MTNIEFYINGNLCDLDKDFGVRLNRKLIDPSQLYAKDAQISYSISLPPTDRNDANFGHINIEETKNKFNREYTAVLIVNTVRIFVGNFRLSNIKRGYKGNLYVPSLRTIKDIFGDIKLNQNPEYRIPFLDFATYVSLYNNSAAAGPQMAIFPLALYGVIPKTPINKNANTYTARNLWDSSARLGMQDLPPSINPFLMLRHIFESQGYDLQGSVFDNDKLMGVYHSYKNAPEYVQPWNYGFHAKINVSGSWSSVYNKRTGDPDREFERGINQPSDNTGPLYSIDMLDATNTLLNVSEDPGGNVLVKEINDQDGVPWLQGQIRIPSSGFYKVQFGASLRVYDNSNWRSTDAATGVQHLSGYSDDASNRLPHNVYEIRLLRDNKQGDFNLGSTKIDGTFYYDNQPQNTVYDEANAPKYVPQLDSNGQLNFIDKVQDRNILLGFEFGRNQDRGVNWEEYINPKDTTDKWAQVQAAKPALSWDVSENDSAITKLAIASPGWWKYGRIGDFDNEGDNPDEFIDYSAGDRETDKVLSPNGNPIDADAGLLDERNDGVYINFATGTPVSNASWTTSDYIPLSAYPNLKFTGTALVNASGAVVAFYKADLSYIGTEIYAPTGGSPINYVDELIVPPTDLAAYVRISASLADTFTITADDDSIGNIILDRFPLERWYNYRFEAPALSGYTGNLYIHNGTDVLPSLVVPFIGGVAEVNTGFSAFETFDPKATLYLKTPAFDVDGTLTIERLINAGSDDIIGWEITGKYEIDLINAPTNFAKRGQFGGIADDDNYTGQGSANAVIWLEAGELLTVASISSEGRYRRSGMHSTYGLVNHEIDFSLEITPFRTDAAWLKMDTAGHGLATMDWDDPTNFDTDSINLVGFLNAEMKTDDYIDNLCKAYNLKLSQTDASTFVLDVAQSRTSVSNLFENLDTVMSIDDRANSPLGLPSLYKIGFTVDQEEEGYATTGEDGGGEYSTGVLDGDILEQKSSFSYNWYKEITKEETGPDISLLLPVISKKDVWAITMPYPEAMAKKYTDLAYRFWYYDGILPGNFQFNGAALDIAKVSNSTGDNILNYKNEPFTILDNFFTVLINGSSHYTEGEANLSALQYARLDGSRMAQFNGDIYYVAELVGYDPAGRNKTVIKLIRKI